MAKIRINGDTSGYIELSAPNVAGSTSITLPATTGGSLLATDASGNLNVDSGVLYVDGVNNRVGIGTTSPNGTLDINNGSTVFSNSGTYIGGIGRASGLVGGTNSEIAITTSAAQGLLFGINNAERARIDASGRLLVGTSSARTGFFDGVVDPLLQVEGSTTASSSLSVTRNSNDADGPRVIFGRSRGTVNTIVQSGDRVGGLTYQGNDGSKFVRAAEIECFVDGTPGTNDMPGRLVFSTTADGASSPSTAMTINQNRTLTCEADVFVKGGIFVSDPITTNRYLFKASTGGGTSTVFIGNAAIQVSSDVRLKDNISDTALNATAELKKVRVVDFTWNDPSDTSYNNRNARGIWTGVIAQELVDVFPFVVNAPRKEEDLSIDTDSESTWTIDQHQLVPVLIKAFQQQQERIETLEAANAALETRLTALEVKS